MDINKSQDNKHDDVEKNSVESLLSEFIEGNIDEDKSEATELVSAKTADENNENKLVETESSDKRKDKTVTDRQPDKPIDNSDKNKSIENAKSDIDNKKKLTHEKSFAKGSRPVRSRGTAIDDVIKANGGSKSEPDLSDADSSTIANDKKSTDNDKSKESAVSNTEAVTEPAADDKPLEDVKVKAAEAIGQNDIADEVDVEEDLLDEADFQSHRHDGIPENGDDHSHGRRRQQKGFAINKENKSKAEASRYEEPHIFSTFIKITLAIALVAGATYLIFSRLPSSDGTKNSGNYDASFEDVTDKQKEDYAVDSADKPQSLTIAGIGISNARIKPVGLLAPASEGAPQQMDAPDNVHDVGWFNCTMNPVASTRCEAYASPDGKSNTSTAAVLDGHSCGVDGCVFDKISDLDKDDDILVTMGDGTINTYKVDKVETVDLDKLDMNKVLTVYQSGKPGLNMITCAGSWKATDSRGRQTMDKRVVVYSTLSKSDKQNSTSTGGTN